MVLASDAKIRSKSAQLIERISRAGILKRENYG